MESVAQEEANLFREKAAQEQRQILNSISVAPFREKVGWMADPLEQLSHSVPHKFSTRGIASTAEWLLVNNRDSNVGEIVDLRDGKKIHYLVREKHSKDTTTREVFEVPAGILPIPAWRIKYANIFITNSRTGVTTDLMDIKRPQTKVVRHQFPNLTHGRLGNFDVDQNKVNVYGVSQKSSRELITYGHEVAHSYQFKDTQPRVRSTMEKINKFKQNVLERILWTFKTVNVLMNTEETDKVYLPHSYNGYSDISDKSLAKIIVRERNAEAFTLALVRRYRELGIDLFPELKNSDLYSTINLALERYQSIMGRPDAKFNKSKPTH